MKSFGSMDFVNDSTSQIQISVVGFAVEFISSFLQMC